MASVLWVFQQAALPQKAVFVVLLASILMALVFAVLAHKGETAASRRLAFVSQLRIAGPALGLLVGSMNAFHMMHTTLRLPASPTAKALAPGVMEIAALVGLGALAGLVATALNAALSHRATTAGSN